MVKAFLTGVSEYNLDDYCELPNCKNDIFQLRKSMINGLKLETENITLIGCDNTVFSDYFGCMLENFLSTAEDKDIIFFYFSGHGNKGNLVLSDKEIPINDIITKIKNSNAYSKIIILDCCHSGDFTLEGIAQLSTDELISEFTGKGCSIMASCSAGQTSGFHPIKDISLYTSFLCDAIEDKYIIREGKKSLEDINKSIRLFNKVWNERNESQIQEPIYRSNMGGTVFFEVEDYCPFPVKRITQNTKKYTIVSVEPLHHAFAKRYAIKVQLKYPCTYEMITKIAQLIALEAQHYEVYSSEIFKKRFQNKPTNIIWCYFGNDNEDMINSNYFCHTTWVDDTQDKSYWYKEKQNSMLINNILIEKHTGYKLIKKMNKCTLTREEFISKAKECTTQLVCLAEKYISLFHEFDNRSFSEESLINLVEPLNKQLTKWFFAQSDLPVAPVDLHDWFEANINLASTIHDLSLFYNKNNLKVWGTSNRHWLVQNTIEKYYKALERLKRFDGIV